MAEHDAQSSPADRVTRSAGLEAPAGSETVRVWDPFVRIFHWSLVALFVTAYVSSEISEVVHIWAGYGVLVLVCLRIVWGVIGTKHARFSDFVFGPATLLRYLNDVVHFRAQRFLGHNPAGGAMVVALLLSLIAVGASGFMMTLDGLWGQKWIEEVHEAFAYGTIVLIVVHVGGVIFSSLEHRENLVRSMFTGRKRR